MHILACLTKRPTESWKPFNERLAEACAVLHPTAARCTIIDGQPKVDLLATQVPEDPPLRMAVLPNAAATDAEARHTEDLTRGVLDVAAGAPVMSVESTPPVVSLFLWPLVAMDPDETAEAAGSATRASASEDMDDDEDEDEADEVEREEGDDDVADDDLPEALDDDAEVEPDPAPRGAQRSTPPPPSLSPAGGRPPFGFRRRGTQLVPHEEEAPVVRTILDGLEAEMTHDRILRRVMEEHGAWVREHWVMPKERARTVARIIERAAFYRRHLSAESEEDGHGHAA